MNRTFVRVLLTNVSVTVVVGLFHPEQIQQEFTFRSAVEAVNMDIRVIPNINLVPRVEYFSHFDSFNTSKRGE